jgi:carbamoyl-phosphate synthase small subunit
MTGYQEVLTDASYHGQIVVFTAPQIGNYGIHEEESESSGFRAAGVVTRAVSLRPSHARRTSSLPEYLEKHRAFGLTDVDTRALTLHIRECGNLRGWMTTAVSDPMSAVARARDLTHMAELRAVEAVTVSERYVFAEAVAGAPRVVVYDFGTKTNILRSLAARGCRVEVVPAGTSFDELVAMGPDGVVLSNGPGDPESLAELVPTVRRILEAFPTLAICLGHQLTGLALGCRITKLPFGHHGANHPVREISAEQVSITSQNHNYAIDAATLPEGLEVSHVNLNDGTVQGIRSRDLRVWSVQFHPEASPGPHEAVTIFDRFVEGLHPGVSG